MSEERFERVETRLAGVEEAVIGIRHDVRELRTEVRALREESRDLRRHMLVLHEETLDRIAALAPDYGPLRREFQAADAELRESLDRRIVPLEAEARLRSRRRRH